MELPFRGGCMCGAVRYECTEPPLRMVNCHCRDCQLASGSGYSATVVMAAQRYEKAAGSGNVARRDFCETCGTPLFASSLDEAGWFKPEADVWVASAQPWDCMDPTTPKFERSRSRAK